MDGETRAFLRFNALQHLNLEKLCVEMHIAKSQIDTTSKPLSLSHLMATEVSSPPEYASTIFFIYSSASHIPI